MLAQNFSGAGSDAKDSDAIPSDDEVSETDRQTDRTGMAGSSVDTQSRSGPVSDQVSFSNTDFELQTFLDNLVDAYIRDD